MVNILSANSPTADSLSIRERERLFSCNSLDQKVPESNGHAVKPQWESVNNKFQSVEKLTNDTWLSIDNLLPANSDLPVADKKQYINQWSPDIQRWSLSLSDLWLEENDNMDYPINEGKLSAMTLWTTEKIHLTLCDSNETYISEIKPINIEITNEEYSTYIKNLEKINLQGDIMVQFYDFVLVPLLKNIEHKWLDEMLSTNKPVHVKLNYLLSNFGFERSYFKLWNKIDQDTNISKWVRDINKRFFYRNIANYVDIDLKRIY